MAIGVTKIDAAAAVPVVEIAIVEAPRGAAIGELRLANALKDRIEFGIVDVERVMVALEFLGVVEKERERVIDTDRRKMAVFPIDPEAKNACKKSLLPSCRGQGRSCG